MHLFLKGKRSCGYLRVVTLIFVSSAQWGFHPGGWGKPPLDEYNRPLYGDVFGVLPKVSDSGVSSLVI
jgi:hypothetical protein